jgi:hypothetical protein
MIAAAGRIVSAKRPGHFARLLDCRATTSTDGHAPGAVVTLPDGSSSRMDDPETERWLTALLGRDVRVVTTALAGSTYEMMFHVVAASTLAQLARLEPSTEWDVRRFRPNIVIDGESAEPFVENSWMSCEVAIGDEVVLHMGPSHAAVRDDDAGAGRTAARYLRPADAGP